MATQSNGSWHNAKGVCLPYRPPPTVDEALPFSPFTSIIPFSLDIVPFPSAEPPTPPSTLTPDQQTAATKAVGILNSEITGQSTAHHLQVTLQHLRELLKRDKLPEYNFKPMPQLATPPESPTTKANGSMSDFKPNLSPFASLLLKETDVSFTPFGDMALQQTQIQQAPLRRDITSSGVAALPRPPPVVANGVAHTQNASAPYPSSALSSVPSSTPDKARGPAVIIWQPSHHDHRREEYKRYGTIQTPESLSQRRPEEKLQHGRASDLRPHEREIADRKIEELKDFVQNLLDDKDDLDGSQYFSTVTTSEGDLSILHSRQIALLSSKMSAVQNLGRFVALPVESILSMQTLLQPAVQACTKIDVFPQDPGSSDMSSGVATIEKALRTAELVLDTMIEGNDDHRLRREELIDSVVDLVKLIKDSCIVPIMRSRKSGSANDIFAAVAGLKKELQQVLHACGTVLIRFATIIGMYNLSDRALNSLEYLTLELFMEQATEAGNSIFSTTKFEVFRQKVMSVLAQIFARHTAQRSSILNGIFSNLEKLPAGKQNVRNFRSRDEADIMTISALFMRFLQTAATNMNTKNLAEETSSPDIATEDDLGDYEAGAASKKANKRAKAGLAPDHVAQNLVANAVQIAAHIADSLIERVLVDIAKSGDKPIRSLLYLFIQDFCNVLISPQWPAAVTLLHQIIVRVVNILHGDQSAKHTANNKDMALSCLETVGVGIIKFKRELRSMKRSLDISESDLSAKLSTLVDDCLSSDANAGVNNGDLLAFDGPFRVVLESIPAYLKATPEDSHIHAVKGCYISSWMNTVLKSLTDEANEIRPQALVNVREHLSAMVLDPKWLARTHKFQNVTDEQCKIAAGIISLQSQVCSFLPRLLHLMQLYLRNDSANLRSKAMSSLTNLVKEDPRVLSESHIKNLVNALTDASPKLRSNTVSLIETCLAHDPSLEKHVLPGILRLTTDSSIAPKKRAIELLKTIYCGPTTKENRLQIALALLLPSQDVEEAVAKLSREVLEDVLLTPTTSTKERSDDNQLKLDRTRRASMVVDLYSLLLGQKERTVERLEAFEKFFMFAISPKSKDRDANMNICKNLVTDLIDRVISPEAGSAAGPQARTMSTLAVLAKVDSSFFTADQIQLLKLYIKDIGGNEDIALVRPTVIIFRHVLPILPTLQNATIIEIRAGLLRNISRLAHLATHGNAQAICKETLADVAHCLWTISIMPDVGPDLLTTTVASILCNLRPLAFQKDQIATNQSKVLSYLILLGTFGKYCNFDKYIETFRAKVTLKARGPLGEKRVTEQQMMPLLDQKSTASRVLLDTIRPFTMQTWDLTIREQALESLGGVCHRSPELFTRGEVEKVIQLVFVNDDNDRLKRVALSFFEEYFAVAERRSESGAQIATGSGAVTGTARLETSFLANENDKATMHLAQRFLPNFVKAALVNDTEHALLATRIIASISRQGLVHPKECGAALVALGTSLNPTIAQLASDEHKRIHEKQESYLEKEYMQSIHIAFHYQVNVFDDPHGMLEATYTPKLARLFEALKTGKKTTVKRFVDNLCKQVDFNLLKLNTSGSPPQPLLFARFCLENIALLDFPHMEEVAVFLNTAEGILFKSTGPAVALAIETEMPKQYAPAQKSQDMAGLNEQHTESGSLQTNDPHKVVPPTIDDSRLRQITTACMILQLLWQTRNFVRRCYNLQKLKGRIPPKRYAETASRNNLVSGKLLWEHFMPIMCSLDNRELMLNQCWEFANLLEVDLEAKVDEEEESNDLGAGYETPPEGNEANGVPMPSSGCGRKRKGSFGLSNTPKKSRGRPKNKKRTSRTPDDDESD